MSCWFTPWHGYSFFILLQSCFWTWHACVLYCIVLLLGSRIAESALRSGANVTRSWLILAWVSTIAGNLTLVGSAANLIVSEEAMKARFLGYELTFFSHLLFGFPSTLLVVAVGLPLIRGWQTNSLCSFISILKWKTDEEREAFTIDVIRDKAIWKLAVK